MLTANRLPKKELVDASDTDDDGSADVFVLQYLSVVCTTVDLVAVDNDSIARLRRTMIGRNLVFLVVVVAILLFVMYGFVRRSGA